MESNSAHEVEGLRTAEGIRLAEDDMTCPFKGRPSTVTVEYLDRPWEIYRYNSGMCAQGCRILIKSQYVLFLPLKKGGAVEAVQSLALPPGKELPP